MTTVRYFQVVDRARQRLIAVAREPLEATRIARDWIIRNHGNLTIYDVETTCLDIWEFAAESLREYPATLRDVPFSEYNAVISAVARQRPPAGTTFH